MAKRNYYRTN